MSEWEVRHNAKIVTTTGWQPMAEAAWHRATRDQCAGGVVELAKDGRTIATHRIAGGRGATWPDGPPCGLRDIAKAVIQLLRDDEWDAKQIATAMTAYGLPTSRARVDGMRGAGGRSADLSAAEIVTMLYAVLSEYRKGE